MKDHIDRDGLCEAGIIPDDAYYSPSPSQIENDGTTTYPKRLFDLVFSALILPILLPVLLLLWVFASKGGPGLYYQNRIGRHGKVFKCYKLRSMALDAEQTLLDLCSENPEIAEEWRVNQKLANDPRITPVGHFLRATSLDELPQIWNVIKGDMSLVGPRPIMENQDDLYRAAGGRSYYSLRPGITGLWQIEGRGTTSFLSRISFDNAYCETQGFWMDFGLILKTVRVVMKTTGH